MFSGSWASSGKLSRNEIFYSGFFGRRRRAYGRRRDHIDIFISPFKINDVVTNEDPYIILSSRMMKQLLFLPDKIASSSLLGVSKTRRTRQRRQRRDGTTPEKEHHEKHHDKNTTKHAAFATTNSTPQESAHTPGNAAGGNPEAKYAARRAAWKERKQRKKRPRPEKEKEESFLERPGEVVKQPAGEAQRLVKTDNSNAVAALNSEALDGAGRSGMFI